MYIKHKQGVLPTYRRTRISIFSRISRGSTFSKLPLGSRVTIVTIPSWGSWLSAGARGATVSLMWKDATLKDHLYTKTTFLVAQRWSL